MNVKIKNQTIALNMIQKFTFNHPRKVLCCTIAQFDKVCFYLYQSNHFSEIFKESSRPSGKKSDIVWSPDGKLLALGSSILELWKLEGNKISPLKNFHDDFIDIKLIAWSPDSLSVCYGGLSKKNTVKIRNLQQNKVQQIKIPLELSAISYDPFGKYLILLVRDNIVYIYDCSTCELLKKTVLHPCGKDEEVSTVRQLRRMDWSPDFNNLVCPSLDDSRISLAVNISRISNFAINQIFLGHPSSITCSKFNPNLFYHQGVPTSIVAIGDSHGTISLWRLSQKPSHQPMIIFNSSHDAEQIIDQLQWLEGGTVLLANTGKKYLMVVKFEVQQFGEKVSEEERLKIVQNVFGVKSAYEVGHKELQIFTIQNSHTPQSSQPKVKPASIDASQIDSSQLKPTQRIQVKPSNELFKEASYVKLSSQVTTTKNNKKRIKPAMLVKSDQVPKNDEKVQYNTHHHKNVVQQCSFGGDSLELRPLTNPLRIIKISQTKYLQIRKVQTYTMIYLNQLNQSTPLNERMISGTIDYCSVNPSHIYILSSPKLYIYDLSLNLEELPLMLGSIHRLAINNQDDIYYVTTKGFVKGFNHSRQVCYLPYWVPISSLMQMVNRKEQSKKEQDGFEIEEFKVLSDHNLYISFIGSKNRYFYNRQAGAWVSLEINRGLFSKGSSLIVTSDQQSLISSFFSQLSNKKAPQQSISYQSYESNLIYYKKHNPSKQLYNKTLLDMLKEMKQRNHNQKLRSTIIRYFVDKTSEVYSADDEMKRKVKEIGGSVIGEFILFGEI